MSEYIVHVAIMQDCFNIMLQSSLFHPLLKEIVMQQRDFGEAASTTMSGDHYTWRILEDLRSRWATRTAEEHLEPKLAFVLGWVSHRAADRQMKPVFRATVDPLTRATIGNECTLYNEAEIYKNYYMNHPDDPYKDVYDILLNRPYDQCFHVEATKKLFNGMLKMAFMRMHTMKPSLTYDVDGIEAWIDNIYTLLQQFKINMELEAQIIAAPDPVKYQKYIVDTCFFSKDDSLIDIAIRLRNNQHIDTKQIDAALTAPQKSDYAIALQTALRYTRACNDYLFSNMTTEALRDALDIGKLGRDGRSV